MFEKSARYYDLFKSTKDYKSEAMQVLDIVQKYHSTGSILEVACGTGEHIKYIKDFFQIEGLDLNKEFINLAKTKNPEVNFYVGDMSDFSVNKKYDAIICLYGGIGYLKTYSKLCAALHCFKNHLNDNGIIIIEPWYSVEDWNPNNTRTVVIEKEELSLVRMSFSENNGNILFHYLIGTKLGIEHFTEYYEFGLFSHVDIKSAFLEIGFDTIYLSDVVQRRGLFIGVNSMK